MAPIIYGLVVGLVAVAGGPAAVVAIVGAVLLGLVHVLLGTTGRTPRTGRQRHRNRELKRSARD